MSTVSAADNDTIYVNNNTGNDSWDGLNATYDPITLHGPKLSIKNATGTVNDGGTVYIANGIYTGINNTNIMIDRNMTIIGQSQTGTIINGDRTTRIITTILGSRLVLQNLTIANGTAFSGGAVSARLTAENCTFINNTAVTVGGAIDHYDTITSCTFIQNTAGSYGGAIFGQGTITSCTFIQNTAGSYGGAIYADDPLTVTNSTFIQNSASDGGAIRTLGSLTVTNSTFIQNNATTDGGAIWTANYESIVTNSTFNNNTANNNGGAIHGLTQLDIADCTLYNNSASYGGAIYCGGYLLPSILTITNSTLYNNTANGFGGAIYYNGTLTLTNSTLYSNTANMGGAIGCEDEDTLTITGCTLYSNTATSTPYWGYGGAIYKEYGNTNIIDSSFYYNTAGNDGGAIYHGDVDKGGILNITNSTFTQNTAQVGGAIVFCGNSTITNSTFYYNTASLYYNATSRFGGAIVNSNLYQYSFKMNFNRIVGNSNSSIFTYGRPTDAENNWWGSNNPIWSDLINFPPPTNWVILTVNATPDSINNTGNSTITADFNHINGGADLVGGHIPDGPITLSIPWGSFANPGITHSFMADTVAGVMSATFFANEGAAPSSVRVDATADAYTTNALEAAYININKVANLTITKTGPATVIAGTPISYTITVANNGPDEASDVHIQDIFPASLSGISWTAIYSNGTTVLGNGNLDINSISLPVGASCTITVTGTVLSSVPSGTVINNTANVTSTSTDFDTTDNSATALTTVNTQYEITINKTVDKARPNVGDTVTFTVTAHNNGPSDALNVQISDLMPADFTDITITPSKGTYNNGTGIWTLDITSGETSTLNLIGKISAIMAGKNTTNTAYYGSNSVNATIYVPKSNLYLNITSSNNNPKVGEQFTLTYKLGNYGPDNATNVKMTIPLPKGFKIGKISGDGKWTYNPATNTITWTLENVPVGDPYLYVTGRFTRPGIYVFGASISSDTYNINTEGVIPITVNAAAVANAQTVGMQQTGLPITGLILAVLALFGGLATSKRK